MDSFFSQAYTANGLSALKTQNTGGLFAYILKGYPRSLKRELIKTVQNVCEGSEAEHDFCSEPFSLVCREKGFAITDGTRPFTAEPKTYGISDCIIDLGAYQNPVVLQSQSNEALALFREIGKLEKRCSEYISAAKGITDDCTRTEAPAVNRPALNRFAARLWKKYGRPPTGRIGTETKYFAEVLTPSGLVFPFEKFSGLCKDVTVINDFPSAVAAPLTDKIRLYTLSCGFDVISFVDFFDGKTVRHIIIPEIGFGIYCERTLVSQLEGAKRIRKNRFLDSEYADRFRSRTAFCKKACSELLSEAARSLGEAEKLRDRLDGIYLSATDAEKFLSESVSKITEFDKSLQKVYN